jgi:Predicted hydrolases or acyltransferases (alpha/beta hydrolase superfamily)
MKSKIKNIDVNYLEYGNEKGKPIVFLHGWGQNIEMMKIISEYYKKDYRLILIDLPGFGETKKPESAWLITDYRELVYELLQKLKVDKPIMIGHSFGGKITLSYASKYECEKIILLASPFRKGIKKLSLKVKMLKSLKKVPGLNKFEEFAKKHIGSRDYKAADPLMRQILVEHVNLDITEDVKKIKCPAFIIWGDLDDEVPYEEAYELENLIKDSGVVILEGGTHYAYIEFLPRVVSIINAFLKD